MITIYFDGACRGNPGTIGSYGYVIYKSGKKIAEGNGILKEKRLTNNIAEFTAAMEALKFVKKGGFKDAIEARGDSKLVTRQLGGVWKVKSKTSKEFVPKIKALIAGMDVNFISVPREENKEADSLCQRVIREHKSKNA